MKGSRPATWLFSCSICRTAAFILITLIAGSVQYVWTVEQFNIVTGLGAGLPGFDFQQEAFFSYIR
jgi:hypothetical protein